MRMIDRRNFIRHSLAASLVASSVPAVRAQTPRSAFGRESTAEEVTAGLDLRGFTAVVTGCNSGIGFETMRVLALRGAHVIGTARTAAKGREACDEVNGKGAPKVSGEGAHQISARATPVVLELADFPSVVACAKSIRALTPRIDMLILNAGVVYGDLRQVYGMERQFVVNHLGHFLLTRHVLDLVKAAPQGRVVTVGSGNHRDAPPGGIQFDDLSGKGWYRRGYAHSKRANGLFSLELAKRLRGTRATSNCLTPGSVLTNIRRHTPGSTPPQLKSPGQGAATQCYVATNPALTKVSGEYFRDCNPADQSDQQRDPVMAAKLWEVSTQLTERYQSGR
jgi:NAD(P)-dependent dehydrogenase (short-subunit alcohol dehydrogenase family)